MELLSIKGSIVCSRSNHFSPTIGISTTWRWRVLRGSIICSYLFQLHIVGIMICLEEVFTLYLILCYNSGVLSLVWWDVMELLLCSHGGDCVWLPHMMFLYGGVLFDAHVNVVSILDVAHSFILWWCCIWCLWFPYVGMLLLATSSCWLLFYSEWWLDYMLLLDYMEIWMILDALYFNHLVMYAVVCTPVPISYSYRFDPFPLMSKGEIISR